MNQQLSQIRINAISTRIAHEYRINGLKNKSAFVDILAIIVPVIYAAIRLLAKDTKYEGPFNFFWELLAALLLAATIAKMTLGWSEKAQQHSRLVGENISLATRANQLLMLPSVSKGELREFQFLADSVEKNDRDALGKVTKVQMRMFYREGLKEIGPDVECPICHSSPWRYTPGKCQACGNTEAAESNE